MRVTVGFGLALSLASEAPFPAVAGIVVTATAAGLPGAVGLVEAVVCEFPGKSDPFVEQQTCGAYHVDSLGWLV